MSLWKRVKPAVEWGFFFGVVSWVLASGISNKIPTWGVWGIILSRTFLGLIIGFIKWDILWWARGILIGIAVNLPLAFVVQSLGAGWGKGFWPFLISGVLFGFLIEFVLRRRSLEDTADGYVE